MLDRLEELTRAEREARRTARETEEQFAHLKRGLDGIERKIVAAHAEGDEVLAEQLERELAELRRTVESTERRRAGLVTRIAAAVEERKAFIRLNVGTLFAEREADAERIHARGRAALRELIEVEQERAALTSWAQGLLIDAGHAPPLVPSPTEQIVRAARALLSQPPPSPLAALEPLEAARRARDEAALSLEHVREREGLDVVESKESVTPRTLVIDRASPGV